MSEALDKVKKIGVPLPGMVSTRASVERIQQFRNMATSSSSVRKFDGRNFTVWKHQAHAYLTLKECAGPLTTTRPIIKSEDWDARDAFARSFLLLSLEDDIASLVYMLGTAKKIRDRLRDSYEQNTSVSKMLMQRKFFEATQQEGESVMTYVARVQRIHSELVQVGAVMSEETLVSRIVAGFTVRFHVFMTN